MLKARKLGRWTHNSSWSGAKLRRGHSVLEVALLCPWLFFVFAGILDTGFYLYALVATENAARAAVEYTSKSTTLAVNSSVACQYALNGLQALPNVRNVSSCGGAPVTVTAAQVTGADGSAAASVTVTYQTNLLIPIPGIPARMNITRTVQMRIL